MLTANNYTPIGAMMYSAGTIAPAGFLIANGAVLSKKQLTRDYGFMPKPRVTYLRIMQIG